MSLLNTQKKGMELATPLIAVFFIFLACYLVTFTGAYKTDQPAVSKAIIGDLLISSSLVYLFLIRNSGISKLTVLRIIVAGLVVAALILNENAVPWLHFAKTWLSPAIEIALISFIIQKFYRANKIAVKAGTGKEDFLFYCRRLMTEVMGSAKAANIISSEIAVFYYAIAGKKSRGIDYETRFSNYKENGISLVLGSILFLFITETVGAHFLLSIWNKTFAWVVTALSLYTCLQLFAHILAIRARPIRFSNNGLAIHNGLAGDAFIEMDNIEKFEMTNKLPAGRIAVKLSLLKTLEGHNCVIWLKQPIEVTKIFGIKKQTNTILFFTDKPKDFTEALKSRLNK